MKSKRLLLHGPCHNGLYSVSSTKPQDLALLSIQTVPNLWHSRLGHPAAAILNRLSVNNNHIHNKSHNTMCTTCQLAKSKQLYFPTSVTTTTKPFELVHSDVWGPSHTTSIQGYRYFVTFIDDYSRFCWVFPLTQKSEFFHVFVNFHKFVQVHFNANICTIRTDGGGEYLNKNFKLYCKTWGIFHQYMCPYTSAQNGVAERKNRHILETIRSLLIQSNTPHTLWVEALHTAIHLINRLPTVTIQYKTPFEMLYQKLPSYTHLKTFGCLCFPWLKPYSKSKLSPLSIPCVFVGYALNQKGFRCFDPNTQRIFVSRHVIFNETKFPFQDQSLQTHKNNHRVPENQIPPLLLVPTSSVITAGNPTNNSNLAIPSQVTQLHSNFPNSSISPTETSQAPSVPVKNLRSHKMQTRSQAGILKPKPVFDLTHQVITPDPTSYKEAVKHEHWRQAMSHEYQALQSQGTWTLVPPTDNQNILGCKWTYRTKYKSDGTLARHKARLVALGYNQEFGIDYIETFSPVAKITTVRVLLILALHHQWAIHQLDVSNAFLHGELSETVFMKQPIGFVDNQHPTYVCKLNKALYGLKQAPRKWFEMLIGFLHQLEFTTSHSDPSLLIYRKDTSKVYVLIYVDDIIVTGNNSSVITQLLEQLQHKFKMRKLGSLNQFLGITVTHTPTGMFLQQTRYAEDILARAGMQNSKPVSTPCCIKKASEGNTELFSNPQLYRQLIGALQYLTLTHPDISYAVNRACQQMHQPRINDFDALKQILRYIRGTTQFGLPINGSSLTLQSNVDSDWAGDHTDRKSTTGYCNFLGTSLISWSVKKQTTIARSSTEAEYRAIALVTTEIIWLRRLLHELDCPQLEPTKFYCDNTSAIALANNPVYHARTKHIEIDCHFIRDCIKNHSIQVHHISTKDQLADLFTKYLSVTRFKLLAHKLINPIDSSVCQGVLGDKNKTQTTS
ncbi:Retrovirus-related Pol polyprotein from transposon TNT 1-94 [Dendrobium catenatum]|uniref:Retrovirus-related Pol polyprotein from transposon TNT 1-94 n=1 Tax=Dendrobium catenatum TaxID=906689 RepID=A0A2I0VIM8_9ASPA|nr:Retrovirus-related Pol polyprotein from transposon TNT 1-94 [Dendrobium catenatum]